MRVHYIGGGQSIFSAYHCPGMSSKNIRNVESFAKVRGKITFVCLIMFDSQRVITKIQLRNTETFRHRNLLFP